LGQDLQTGTAWALKENFRRFWKYTSVAWALKFLWEWVETARATELTPLVKAADMIDKHAEGILHYLMHPITNAAAEGINSVIQSLKHAAHGLPKFESFRIRVLFFLGKLDLNPAYFPPLIPVAPNIGISWNLMGALVLIRLSIFPAHGTFRGLPDQTPYCPPGVRKA
jgi:hypothetical protein